MTCESTFYQQEEGLVLACQRKGFWHRFFGNHFCRHKTPGRTLESTWTRSLGSTSEWDWSFHGTAFSTAWAVMTQWRYVKIAAFMWLVLGYSMGWTVAAAPFRDLVVVIVGGLALCSLTDAVATTITLVRGKKPSSTEAGGKA